MMPILTRSQSFPIDGIFGHSHNNYFAYNLNLNSPLRLSNLGRLGES